MSGHTVSIRVFDEVTEVSKVMLDDVSVYREGILTFSGDVSYLTIGANDLNICSPIETITIDTACTDLLLWSEDDQDEGYEYRLMIAEYVGVGVDLDGDGAGTLSTSAEKSINVCGVLLSDASKIANSGVLYSGLSDGGTKITTTAGHLDGYYAFLIHTIVTRKLCNLIPLVHASSSAFVEIRIMKNINRKRIHWSIYKR